MYYPAAILLSVVDAEGEMQVTEIAPVVHNLDVLDPRARQLTHSILRAVPKAHINAVVVFSLFVLLPCGERGNRVRLHERVVAIVLARRIVVFIVGGEGKKKHSTVFVLGIVYPCRHELNLLAVGIFIVVDNAPAKEIHGLQTALVEIIDIDTPGTELHLNLTADGADNEVSVSVLGIEQLVDGVIASVLPFPSGITLVRL